MTCRGPLFTQQLLMSASLSTVKPSFSVLFSSILLLLFSLSFSRFLLVFYFFTCYAYSHRDSLLLLILLQFLYFSNFFYILYFGLIFLLSADDAGCCCCCRNHHLFKCARRSVRVRHHHYRYGTISLSLFLSPPF